MYLSYILYTNIHINTILKYTFQNGGNIIFYRNFLEKNSEMIYKKKLNTYIIFSNFETINIINTQFKNRVKVIKYDITKLKFLNSLNSMNLKIYKYEMIDNNEFQISNDNLKIYDFFKNNIKENIMDTLKKVCTQYIPVNINLITHDEYIDLNIFFEKNIKLKYKYIIYLILKNKMLSFYLINHNYDMNENYSFVIL